MAVVKKMYEKKPVSELQLRLEEKSRKQAERVIKAYYAKFQKIK